MRQQQQRAGGSVKLLLSRGAKPHVQAGGGFNPLQTVAVSLRPAHWSSQADEVVHLLVAAGLSVNKTDKNGCPPLHYAASHGHLPMVCVLLHGGASIDKAGWRMTALHCAVFHGSIIIQWGSDDAPEVYPKARP